MLTSNPQQTNPRVEQQFKAEAFLSRFKLNPLDLKMHLDEYIVGQEFAKDVVATALCTHYRKAGYEELKMRGRARTPKSNVLLIGSTGTGKTTILRTAASYLGIPFIETDASQYTSAGYVGEDTDSIVEKLLEEAGGDISLAELGIVFLDEIDKIRAESGSYGRDVAGGRVQEELLKLLEGREITFKEFNSRKQVNLTIDTQNILFVLGGAFDGIDEKLKASIGFGAQQPDQERDLYLALRQYGMIDQLIGRVPFIATLDRLTQEELAIILSMPGSDIRTGKVHEFAAYGIGLEFRPDGLQALAEKAYARNLGGRGLKHVIDNILMPFQFKLPSTNIANLVVDARLVNHPQETLDALLRQHPIVTKSSKPVLLVSSPNNSPPQADSSSSKRCFFPDQESFNFNGYVRQLREEGMPREYRTAAAKYARIMRVSVKDMNEILARYKNELRDYEESFSRIKGKTLCISAEAEVKLIRYALSHATSVYNVLQMKISRAFSPEIVERIPHKEITFTSEAYHNPEMYARSLCREG
ncbi:MAG: AAA family ATPase [Candidatus Woesearchaeota archaeon]